jgi:uncharacterized membrane protein YhaH (DUF805 family)
MKFGEAIKSFFRKYATFSGRARRSEYWFAVLFVALVGMAASIINPGHMDEDGWRQSGTLENLWSLATLVPSLAIGVRRLHDTGRSGKYLFWLLLPLAGAIMVIVRLCEDSAKGANDYGDPVK